VPAGTQRSIRFTWVRIDQCSVWRRTRGGAAYTLPVIPVIGRRAAALLLLWAAALSAGTPLDDYVHAPDSHFRYSLVDTTTGPHGSVLTIQMTSQAWLPPGGVDRTEWKHWVFIYKPRTVRPGLALLFIGAGSNDKPRPETSEALARMAEAAGAIVAEVYQIPNQPLTFHNDPYGPRSEDEIVAHTWAGYIRTGDASWPLRLPMTKAVVRAMDVVSASVPEARIEKFVVSGGSKRGWTTWTTAAVDRRVTAIMPVVIDLLNIVPSFEHHYRAYGAWAPAVEDYVKAGVMDRFRSPEFHALMQIVEPYEYRDRFVMPKYIVNSAGDQFFLPDSSQFYFDDLPGERYLRYIPNTDHSLKDSDVYESLTAFYRSVVERSARPQFGWKFAKDGAIRVTAKTPPSAVKLWRATNPEHRDFRLETIGPAYRATELKAGAKGVYAARVRKPAKGWTAYFVELTFPGPGKEPFKFTTPVRVIPDTLLYPAPK
jgi:PhoPQ-activated pathogenicity-related protein